MGLAYAICLASLYVYVLAGPAFQKVLLARPEAVAHWAASLARFFDGELIRTILFSTAYGSLWLMYVLALKRGVPNAFSRQRILWWAAGFAALLWLLPPHFSDDIIAYTQHGRVLAEYGQNPYLHNLLEHPDDPLTYKLYWSSFRAAYGPVMILLLAGASWLGSGSLALTILIVKLIMSCLFLLTGWLVGRVMDRTAPEESARAMFFFLWNPMVLMEIPGQGHNDAVMFTLLLAGFFFIVSRKPILGWTGLLLSALAKVTTAVTLPYVAALWLRRREYSTLLKAATVSAIIVFGFWWAFFQDPQSLASLRDISRNAWITPTWAAGEILKWMGTDPAVAHRVAQTFFLGIVGLFVLWRMFRADSEGAVLREATWALIVFLLVGNNQTNAWYLTLLVPAVAVARCALAERLIIVIAVWPLLLYFRPLFYNASPSANAVRFLIMYGALLVVVLRAWQSGKRSAGVPAASAGRA